MSIQFSQTLHNLNLQNDATTGDHAVRLSQLEQRESQLQTTLQDYANNQITTLIDGAPDALNTLNEIAAALDDDQSLAANLNQSITTLRTDFEAADTAIYAEISTVRTDLEAADSSLRTDLDAEIISRVNMDMLTLANIDTEKNDRIAAVSAEAAARTADVATLNTTITTVRTDLEAADTQLQSNIDTEVNKRTADVASLVNSISSVRNDFVAADSTLQSNIDAEASARTAAVSAEAAARAADVATLGTTISTVRTDLEAADSTLQSNLDAEVNTRTNEVNSLTNSISSVRNDFAAADTALQTSLSQNVATLEAADQAEVQARQAEVSRLEVDIGNKIDSSNGVATGVLNTEHVAVNTTSYLYIGDKWRIKANADGSQLNFEYAGDGTGAVNPSSASWMTAIPFITSTV